MEKGQGLRRRFSEYGILPIQLLFLYAELWLLLKWDGAAYQSAAKAGLGMAAKCVGILYLCLTLFNLVWSLVHSAPRYKDRLMAGMVINKYLAIPLYIGIFLLGFVISASLFLIGGPLGPLSGGAIMVFDYLILLSLMPYSLGYLICKLRSRELSVIKFILHLLLQGTFCLDVVDTMYLTAIGEGKWKKAAVAVIMGIILIVLGLLLYLSKWT
jgi:hypothetical protein